MALSVDLTNRRPRTTDELGVRCRDAGLVVDRSVDPDDLATALALVARFAAIVDPRTMPCTPTHPAPGVSATAPRAAPTATLSPATRPSLRSGRIGRA